jgi:hypothetical protein
MPEQPINVSVITPLTPAIGRVRSLLFSPFDIGTWLVLGFCVWLAELGRFKASGGAGFRFGENRGISLRAALSQARDYLLNNLVWIVPLASVLLLLALVIWLALTWVSSRGQFMLLHDVVHGRAEISAPWTRYGRHGDSLFLFRVVVGLIWFGLMLPFLAFLLWMLSQMTAPEGGTPLPILGLILAALLGTGVALLLAVVRKLTLDFVAPIMYLHTTSCLGGWRRLWALMVQNPGQFLLYILFSVALAIGIGILVLAVILVTCCCAGCLMAIPYVGTVVLLPISIFKRCYSLEYLAQYGSEFNAFVAPAEPH